MKDRFTSWILVIVAFVGGLAAMVFIAGWRQDEPNKPAAAATTTAQAIVEPRENTDEAEPRSPADSGTRPASSPARHDDSDATAATIETPDAPSMADPYPAEAGESRAAPQTREPGTTGPAAAVSRDRPRVDAEPSRPRDSASDPPQGGASAVSPTPGSATRSPAGREISSAPKGLYLNSQQGGSRSSPRAPATGRGSEPTESSGTEASPDAQQDHAFEDGSDPGPDSPWNDEPQDEQEPDPDPNVDSEPEAPPALVRLTPAGPQFAAGQMVPVTVEIFSGTDVGHVPFYLDFDPRVLRFAHGEEGEFLGLDGVQTMFVATQSSGGDAVVVGLSRLGRNPGIDGNGRLCVLYFEAVAPGSSNLRFNRAKVKDSSNNPVPALFEDAAVLVR